MRRIRLTLALLLLLGLAPGAAADDAPLHLAFERYVLDNGLTVILHEDHRLPLVATDLWVRVGAADEPPGRSGFAHLFEHLMFMGTERVPHGRFDEIMEEGGASNNADTDFDRTEFHALGPARMLPTLLWLEAERLDALGRSMTQEKLDLQRDVVNNERRESYEASPDGELWLQLYPRMFPRGHPYHDPVIGSPRDLARATVEDVREFFESYYVPNDMSLVVAGDFDPTVVRRLVGDLFGGLRCGLDLPRPSAPPARLDAPARIVLRRDVEAARLLLAWHAPAQYAPGDAEMDLLADILAGGDESRLVRRLVHQDAVATDVSAWQESLRLGSLFCVLVTAPADADRGAIERAVGEVLADVREKGVTDAEVRRSASKIQTGDVADLQSLVDVAGRLNDYETAFGTPDGLARDLRRYADASPATVDDHARRVLGAPGLTMWLVPSGGEGHLDTRPEDLPPRPAPTPVPTTFRLANGLTVWFLPRHDVPLVSARLLLPGGGSLDGPTESGETALASGLSLEGAGPLDAPTFAEKVAEAGTRIDVSTDREATTYSFVALRAHADDAMGLLALAVTSPRLEEGTFQRLKERRLEGLAEDAEDPDALAQRVAWDAYLAPRVPALARAADGTPASVGRLDVATVAGAWRRGARPDGAVLLVAGDLQPDEARALAERAFGGWTAPAGDASPPAPAAVAPAGAATAGAASPGAGIVRVVFVDRPGATQTTIRLLLPAPAWGDPDRQGFRALGLALGGVFSSRLNASLRESHGWTYGAYANVVPEGPIGVLDVGTSVETSVTGPALAQTLAEIRRLAKGDLTAEEASKAIRTLSQLTVESLATLGETLGLFEPFARHRSPPEALLAEARDTAKLDADVLNALARKRLTLDGGVLVLVGDRSAWGEPLKDLGLPEPRVLTPEEALSH